MDETDALIRAVETFEERQNPLSEDLERFISYIAKTGDILAPWEKVQKVFVNKLHLVLDEFYEAAPYKAGKVNANAVNDEFQEMKTRLTQLTEEFDDPPFTIQRLCELLVDPKKNYTKCDKFMRGLEKNLMVVSSWNNLPRRASDSNERVNGMVGTSNGYTPGSDRYNPHWANLPPSPISTTPPKIPGAPDFTAVAFPKLDPLEKKEENKEEKSEDKPDEPMETETKEQEVKSESSPNDEDKIEEKASTPPKPTVSATIISSSPPTTINIKRKLDGTVVQVSKDDKDADVEEASPTKKVKQDENAEKSEDSSDVDKDAVSTKTETPEGAEKEPKSAVVESAKTKQNLKVDSVENDSVKKENDSGDNAGPSEISAESAKSIQDPVKNSSNSAENLPDSTPPDDVD